MHTVSEMKSDLQQRREAVEMENYGGERGGGKTSNYYMAGDFKIRLSSLFSPLQLNKDKKHPLHYMALPFPVDISCAEVSTNVNNENSIKY